VNAVSPQSQRNRAQIAPAAPASRP
jgi:hypothetical protein